MKQSLIDILQMYAMCYRGNMMVKTRYDYNATISPRSQTKMAV